MNKKKKIEQAKIEKLKEKRIWELERHKKS